MRQCRFANRDAIRSLARGLRGCRILTDVTISRCMEPNGRHVLSDNSIATLIRSLEHSRELKRLSLRGNNCSDRAISALASVMDTTSVKLIDLSHSLHRREEFIDLSLLVGALARTTSLESLELNCSNLSSDQDMANLAAALMYNASIKYIDLSHTNITNSGLEVLSSRVSSFKHLKSLAIKYNPFDDEGAKFLASAMKENLSLCRIACDSGLRFALPIRYYADLNQCGRKYVKTFSRIGLSLWPLILERAANLPHVCMSSRTRRRADAIYFLLRQGLPPLQQEAQKQRKNSLASTACAPVNKHGTNKKRLSKRARHRLLSIYRDAQMIEKMYDNELPKSIRKLPLIANERCGSWYLRKATSSCHFKSTDGHVNTWNFSLKRLNLPLIHRFISKDGGCVIVDSSVRKRLPDSFSRTIPIWVAVMNRIVVRYADELGISSDSHSKLWNVELRTPAGIVSSEEHAKICDLLDSRVQALHESQAIVDPNGLVNALKKPMRVLWMDDSGNFYPANSRDGSCFEASSCQICEGNFYDIICWNPSIYQTKDKHNFLNDDPLGEGGLRALRTANRSHVEWIDEQGYFYTPGAADDHESWASCLSIKIFWDNYSTLLDLSKTEDQVDDLIHSLMSCRESIGSLDQGPRYGFQPAAYCDKIGMLDLWIGSRRAAKPPNCWESFDAIINITMDSYRDNVELPNNKFILQLPVEEGKRDKTELEKWMPLGLVFLIVHMQKGRRVLVHCAQGRDRSVAVVLAFCCLACSPRFPLELKPGFMTWRLEALHNKVNDGVPSYKNSGIKSPLVNHLLSNIGNTHFLIWIHRQVERDPADGPLVDKDRIRIILHLIRQHREVAEPSRSTMQKVNRLLMSCSLYRSTT